MRAEENGTAASARQPSGAGNAWPMARRVALGLGSAAARAPRAAAAASVPAPSWGTSSCTARSPAVIVPVLSKQITSTLARVSTAGSSRTSTWRRPRRTTPTAKATLVSSTSPSGTMATVPATAPLSPARTPCARRSWLTNSRTAVGTRAQVTYLRIWSTPARSSERARVKRRASSVSWTA